ncbi:glycosyltransferase [Parabacteroides sp. OttesenSCG-928-N08]|nr:glycosyltransferase [Parabacteroides sp. OttesenSCG-928-N08]
MNFLFSSVELGLMAAAGCLFLLLLCYWLIVYARPLRHANKTTRQQSDKPLPPVSVVVYSHNERELLRQHLPLLLSQDYPQFEVIVVNDGPTDEKDELLSSLKQQYDNIYFTFIPNDAKYLSRKKLALTMGIKAAKYETLLFSEVNCKPLSNQWIRAMMSSYGKETQIVLGFCAYGNYKGLFHRLIAYDNLLHGIEMISPALRHKAFTANGRNLSYKKALFFQHKGFHHSLNLHAGDDDLFVNRFATSANTEVTYTPDAITQMERLYHYKVWREYKVSRAATQKQYKGLRHYLYGFEPLLFFLFLAVVIASIIVGIQGNWIVAASAALLYLVRLATKAIILHKSANMLQQKPTTWWLPLFEIIQPLYGLYVRIYRVFLGKNDYTFRLG